MDDLQNITDQLSASLNRAVYLEDHAFHPLAASAQIGSVDDARVQALLQRGPTERHLRYFINSGVIAAREALRIPASAQQELLPRVMIPVVAGAQVLARVWLIDADPPVTDDDIIRGIRACHDMRPHLLGRRNATRQNVEVGTELLRDIQLAGKNRRRASFKQLRSDYEIENLERTRVAVAKIAEHGCHSGAASDSEDPVRFDGLLDTLMELLDVTGAVGCARNDDLIVLVTPHEAGSTVLEAVSAAASRASALHETPFNAIGIGGSVGSTDGFNSSLSQAEFAARIAVRVPDMDGAACWDNLAEYRLFYALEWNRAGIASLNPGVASLIDEHRTPLAATLLAYLEREGDVNATAAALKVHRTTLYYRIERAREIMDQDPTGPSRFSIHAALRLADLAGLCEPAYRS